MLGALDLDLLFLILFIAGTLVVAIWAYGIRSNIESQDPLFAAALYRTDADWFWSRGFPIRGHVLLFTKAQAIARSTLFPLQVAYFVNSLFLCLSIYTFLRA